MKYPLFALLLALLASGCFYEAPISDEPSREIDKALMGEWTISDEPGSKLTITGIDGEHYGIDYLVAKQGGAPEVLKFKGYHTAVGSKEIVSLQLIEPKGKQEGKWIFLTYTSPEAGRVEVRSINSKVVPFPPGMDPDAKEGEKLTTSEAMSEFIQNVIDKPDLFNPEPMILIKAQ